ncbi:MAG: endonuclease III [Candidatus Aenigmatarchaeota archaeon]
MKRKIENIFHILKGYINQETMVSRFVKKGYTPFQILVATILSARTKDELTEKVSEKLFKEIKEPKDLLKFSEKELREKIYPVGFYNSKAKNLVKLAKLLEEKYNGKIPSDEKELLKLPGVGRKTANIILSYVFNIPTIAVDTHVHRIFNRLGFVKTKKPEETEIQLKKIVPRNLWKDINNLFVIFGKNICKPKKPNCKMCLIRKFCYSARL